MLPFVLVGIDRGPIGILLPEWVGVSEAELGDKVDDLGGAGWGSVRGVGCVGRGVCCSAAGVPQQVTLCGDVFDALLLREVTCFSWVWFWACELTRFGFDLPAPTPALLVALNDEAEGDLELYDSGEPGVFERLVDDENGGVGLARDSDGASSCFAGADSVFDLPRNRFRRAPELFLSTTTGDCFLGSTSALTPSWRCCSACRDLLLSNMVPRSRSLERRVLSVGCSLPSTEVELVLPDLRSRPNPVTDRSMSSDGRRLLGS